MTTPAPARAQQATVSVRVVPFGWHSATPLFSLRIDESKVTHGLPLPALTLTNTKSGPEVTNLALALPELSIAGAAVSSRFGDQQLPTTFLSSPLSGASMHWPMRGVSVSTAGDTPWTFSLGQLDAGYGASGLVDSPSVMALAVSLAPHRRLSLAPRLLVPVGSGDAWQTTIGTAVRADLLPHLSLVSDLGAADRTRDGWAPLASAGLVGHWRATEVETSVLRGSSAGAMDDAATVGSQDRELARARVQALPGLTIAGRASRSRPASGRHAPETKAGSIGVAYDRFTYGRLSAAQERQVSSTQALDTTRVEWRPPVMSGIAVRYVRAEDRRGTAARPSSLIEVDLPSVGPRHPGSRLRLRAALAASTRPDLPALSSRISGRFDASEHVRLAAETELRVARAGEEQLLRSLRLTTDVGVVQDAVLQLRYAYSAGTPFSVSRGLEARISRSIDLSNW